MDSADTTAAGAASADTAGAATTIASIQDRAFLMADLRSSHLPKGLSRCPNQRLQCAKLAVVWSTCGALADATDSSLRSVITNGRLPRIGLDWLRRLHDALSHLHLRNATNAPAVNAADRAEDESRADLVGMDDCGAGSAGQ
jgi:hypothetical protein